MKVTRNDGTLDCLCDKGFNHLIYPQLLQTNHI